MIVSVRSFDVATYFGLMFQHDILNSVISVKLLNLIHLFKYKFFTNLLPVIWTNTIQVLEDSCIVLYFEGLSEI